MRHRQSSIFIGTLKAKLGNVTTLGSSSVTAYSKLSFTVVEKKTTPQALLEGCVFLLKAKKLLMIETVDYSKYFFFFTGQTQAEKSP